MTVTTHPGSSANGESPSLRTLIGSVSGDVKTLASGSVELAKAELAGSGKAAARLVAFAVVALVLLTAAGIMMLFFFAYLLVNAGLPVWAAFLLVAAVLTVVALLLLFLAYRQVRRITPPTRAIASAQETLAALRGPVGN